MSGNRKTLDKMNMCTKKAVATSARYKTPAFEPDCTRLKEVIVMDLDKNFKSCHSLDTKIANQKMSKNFFLVKTRTL